MDTDVFIDLLRKRPNAVAWVNAEQDLPYLSGVAAIEASFGALSALELYEITRSVDRFTVMWPSDEDVRRATDEFSILRLVHGIGILDAICAATALRYALPLATFNVKHFRAIPDLVTVQPYHR